MAEAIVRELTHRPVILVVGGGYVGLYAALRLQKKLSGGRAEIIVVDPPPAPWSPGMWWSRSAAHSTGAG
jgi:glycine/D-amino acid oxidase-like deaminating enzyme